MAHDPVVFISSTSDDLNEHREQAAKAARSIGFSTRMMEDFPASGHAPTLPAYLEMVAPGGSRRVPEVPPALDQAELGRRIDRIAEVSVQFNRTDTTINVTRQAYVKLFIINGTS